MDAATAMPDPSDKIDEHVPEHGGDSAGTGAAEPGRLSLLDVFAQQIMASRAQAVATIAACDAALTTVGLMRAQVLAAARVLDERRAQAHAEPTRPATFGNKARARSRDHTTTTEGGTGHDEPTEASQ